MQELRVIGFAPLLVVARPGPFHHIVGTCAGKYTRASWSKAGTFSS